MHNKMSITNNTIVKRLGGVILNNKNMSIGCNVSECKYHAKSDDYCSLDHIDVTHHNHPAKSVEETDCGSFKCEGK